MQPEHWLTVTNLSLIFLLKVLCFLLGYKIVRIGADLLREGVKGQFKFNAGLAGTKADLASASPGLLFLLLGVLLIGFAMWVNKVVEVPLPNQSESLPMVSEDFPLPNFAATPPAPNASK
mgnify:CR=1 FL=1